MRGNLGAAPPEASPYPAGAHFQLGNDTQREGRAPQRSVNRISKLAKPPRAGDHC
jgi:hypothetical protein